MKLFFDSNVWVSAFATRGLCADILRLALRLHGQSDLLLLVSPTVRDETIRILRDKIRLRRHDIKRVEIIMSRMEETGDGDWVPPPDFPDPNDVPIVGAALSCNAGLLVTGDRALLELERIRKLRIVDPRTAYADLKGLPGT